MAKKATKKAGKKASRRASSSSTRDAVEAVRDTLHEQCKDMRPVEYKEVLEELLTDIEGNLEALKEENESRTTVLIFTGRKRWKRRRTRIK
jgi:hypothetical protein